MSLYSSFLVIYLTLVFAITVPEITVREMFHETRHTEESLIKIISVDSDPDDLISAAYKGLCEAMMAEYSFFPNSKLSHFNKGKSGIEIALIEEPNNAELRYIRLLLQLNVPSFLGYGDNIEDDFQIFYQACCEEKINSNWKGKFIENLLNSKNLSISQKNKLESLSIN